MAMTRPASDPAAGVPSPTPEGVSPPWTPAGRQDPYPWFARMLAERPLAYDASAGIWHIFRYDDVHDFLKDHDTWSTAKRIERVPPAERVTRLLTSDPPQHVKLREYFARAYRPKVIAAMEDRIRAVTRDLIGQALGQRRFDVVEAVIFPLTVVMICELIGVPVEEQREFTSRARAGAGLGGTERNADGSERVVLYMGGANPEVQGAIDRFFADLIARRRAEPRDDLVTHLAQIPEDELLGKVDVGALLNEQLGAGQNTTVHLIGTMLALLMQRPDQLALLRARPELIPGAVEETVRYSAPLQARPRISTRPARVQGVEIPEGATGLAWLQGANLDPAKYPDPLRWDVMRAPKVHLGFGFGEHYCLGNTLARMEARIAIEEWLRMVGDFQRTDDQPLAWCPDFVMRGLNRLDIEALPA